MIKIEFPADRTDIAKAIGRALLEIGGGPGVVVPEVTNTIVVTAGEELAPGDAVVVADVLDDGPNLSEQIGEIPYDPNTGETTAPEPKPEPEGVRVDHNQVPFDADFCGKAAKPFYGAGKKAGQWKKRQGVEQDDYDTWYAEELEAIAAMDKIAGEIHTEDGADAAAAFATEQTVDTGAAFAAQGGASTAQETADAWVPAGAGALMGWVTSKQVAQKLTAQDVPDAYAQACLTVPDLFAPTPPDKCAENTATIYGILVAKAGP